MKVVNLKMRTKRETVVHKTLHRKQKIE